MNRRALTLEEREDATRLRRLWKDRKEELHLSQVKVAEQMGFASQAAVSQYLNARLPLNMVTVAKFAQVLKAKVEDISPRYAKMVGTPIPSSLDGYTAPQTGSVGGVPTDDTLNWFAFSKEFLDAMKAKSIKVVRLSDKKHPNGVVLLVDDSPQQSVTSGTYLMQQGNKIVLRGVKVQGDSVTIENGKKMSIPKEALDMIKMVGRVVATFEPA